MTRAIRTFVAIYTLIMLPAPCLCEAVEDLCGCCDETQTHECDDCAFAPCCNPAAVREEHQSRSSSAWDLVLFATPAITDDVYDAWYSPADRIPPALPGDQAFALPFAQSDIPLLI